MRKLWEVTQLFFVKNKGDTIQNIICNLHRFLLVNTDNVNTNEENPCTVFSNYRPGRLFIP